MRGVIDPRKSAAHRLACLALYHGLLRQSARFSDPSIATTLKNLVRYRFSLDRKISSPTVICDALTAGRKVYALLRDTADGSSTAQAHLTSTLEQVARHATDIATVRTHQKGLRSPTKPNKLSKIAHLEHSRTKAWAAKIPNPIPILDRPVPQSQLPNPDKPRRIPILSSSQGIPFLRYKSGAQSHKLSRILQELYMHDFKRWETHARLQAEIEHAQLEDEWDRNVYMQTGIRDVAEQASENGRPFTKSWTEDVQNVLKDLSVALKATASKRVQMSQRMWEVVVNEKTLAAKEKEERKVKRAVAREQSDQG